MLVCESCVQSALARVLRRRAVHGGSDMSLLLGCDLFLSGLSGSLILKLNLWQDSAASFLTMQSCRFCDSNTRWCALILPWTCGQLVAHWCSVMSLLLSRTGCNSMERVVMGDLHRHFSVMGARWNVFQRFSSAFSFSRV